MKICKNYKEFIKISRKYWKRNWRKYQNFWTIWVLYDIMSITQAEEVERHKKYYKGNLPLILEEYIKYKNNYCYFSGPHEFGKLVGIEITNEDYYYIYENLDGKIKYESCVGHIKYLPGVSKEDIIKIIENKNDIN